MQIILRVAVLTLLAIAVPSAANAAKLYKCVSATGQITYKQSRCVDDKQEKVLDHKSDAERRQEAQEKEHRRMEEEQAARLKMGNEEAKARAEKHAAGMQQSRQQRVEAAIDGGFTVTGMSKDEVRMALGDPTSISVPTGSSMGVATELWVYRARDKTDYVHFMSGRVVSKSGHE